MNASEQVSAIFVPLERATRTVLQRLGPARLIVNLGHGVLPETPPEHVAALATLVRGGG